MKKKTKVYIIDDRDIIRDTIKLFLTRHTDIEVIGEADSGEDAISDLKDKNPDIILTDIYMPFMNGFDLLDWIKKEKKEAKILVMSVNNEDHYVIKSLAKGASGFFVKNDHLSELYTALKKIISGGFYLSESISYMFFSKDELIENFFSAKPVRIDENVVNSFQKKRLFLR